MTLVITKQLKCDGHQTDCEKKYPVYCDPVDGKKMTAKELREYAKKVGWSNRGGQDLCNSCTIAGC